MVLGSFLMLVLVLSGLAIATPAGTSPAPTDAEEECLEPTPAAQMFPDVIPRVQKFFGVTALAKKMVDALAARDRKVGS